jgi:hypothetical protein
MAKIEYKDGNLSSFIELHELFKGDYLTAEYLTTVSSIHFGTEEELSHLESMEKRIEKVEALIDSMIWGHEKPFMIGQFVITDELPEGHRKQQERRYNEMFRKIKDHLK